MATPDHLNLSTFIKSVHSNLKENSKYLGFEKAWMQHCQNEQILKKYAHAMKELATNHWQNNFRKCLKASSRVDWVYKYCMDYFFHETYNELRHQRERELEISRKIEIIIKPTYLLPSKCLKLLDVGSCYNPFAVYDIFDVIAIDIAPGHPNVLKMDFLNVEINRNSTNSPITDSLPCEFFDVIVFSLFLEYLPTPDLRVHCCEKALKLLKYEGLLFIITPDSKHVGANAQIIKSWQFVLAKIGFSRVKYEKLPHIHCMAYRKSLDPKITKRWSDLNGKKQVYDKMHIPQDFLIKENSEHEVVEQDHQNNFEEVNHSLELPFANINFIEDI
ncbi:hypothetical protein WA026_014734 [Henosepilachna vigintioctopunctata]|uniref:S-adenosylmethionine sensor upstream of mTORC1 n=1 Tax=Henosepilachna vigintioctopunctata TaxID=420089 RepID=A0AAW1VH01_9CUCU